LAATGGLSGNFDQRAALLSSAPVHLTSPSQHERDERRAWHGDCTRHEGQQRRSNPHSTWRLSTRSSALSCLVLSCPAPTSRALSIPRTAPFLGHAAHKRHDRVEQSVQVLPAVVSSVRACLLCASALLCPAAFVPFSAKRLLRVHRSENTGRKEGNPATRQRAHRCCVLLSIAAIFMVCFFFLASLRRSKLL